MWVRLLSSPTAGWELSSTVAGVSFVGYKHAGVTFRPTPTGLVVGFVPLVSMHHIYGTDDAAYTPKCEATHIGGVEPVDCGELRCGFHALADPDQIRRLDYSGSAAASAMRDVVALLQVELYGTVVEGETGFRGGRQVVRHVTVPRRCFRCRRRTVAMNPPTQSFALASPACRAHMATGAVTLAELSEATGVPFVLGEPVAPGTLTQTEMLRRGFRRPSVLTTVISAATYTAVVFTFFGLEWWTVGSAAASAALALRSRPTPSLEASRRLRLRLRSRTA